MVKSLPVLLSAKLGKTVRPKIKIFQDLGFSANEVAKIISDDPLILKLGMNKGIIPALSVLRKLLGSDVEVAKHLKKFGRWLLQSNLNKNLVRNVEFLKICGIDIEHIKLLMYYSPRLLLRKPEILKKFVEKVEEMGIGTSSGMFIHALRVCHSLSKETLEMKVKTFKELGFSEDDIAATFRTAPLVFGLSEKKIKAIKEVFLATGKYKLSCIIKNPVSFMYSIDKRYKPRLNVLEILESKNIIRSWPVFSSLCYMSEKKFYEKFVGPYLDEVGDVYMAKSQSVDKTG